MFFYPPATIKKIVILRGAPYAPRRTSTYPPVRLVNRDSTPLLSNWRELPLTTPSETPSASCNAHTHSANKTRAPAPAKHLTAPTCSCTASREPTFPPPPAAAP